MRTKPFGCYSVWKPRRLHTAFQPSRVHPALAFVLFAITLFGAGQVWAAEPLNLLVCVPGGAGSTEDAKTRMSGFFAAFTKRTGLEIRGEYHTNEAACERFTKSTHVDLVIYPYSTFLSRIDSENLMPVVEVVRRGQGQNRYYLVAAKGATLENLKGSKLAGPHMAELDFLSGAAFGKQLDLRSHFVSTPMPSALKAIKALAKGDVGAVLLDENERRSLSELPFAADFGDVLVSEGLPGAPLCVVGGKGDLAATLRKALPGLCSDSSEACSGIEVEALKPADASTYAPLKARLAP